MKLVSLSVMVVLTVISARACGGSSSKASPLRPGNVLQNGIAGLCANQQATADAAGNGSSLQTLNIPATAQLPGLQPGSITCPTTTGP